MKQNAKTIGIVAIMIVAVIVGYWNLVPARTYTVVQHATVWGSVAQDRLRLTVKISCPKTLTEEGAHATCNERFNSLKGLLKSFMANDLREGTEGWGEVERRGTSAETVRLVFVAKRSATFTIPFLQTSRFYEAIATLSPVGSDINVDTISVASGMASLREQLALDAVVKAQNEAAQRAGANGYSCLQSIREFRLDGTFPIPPEDVQPAQVGEIIVSMTKHFEFVYSKGRCSFWSLF